MTGRSDPPDPPGRDAPGPRRAGLGAAADAVDRVLVLAIRAGLSIAFLLMSAVVTYQVFSRFLDVIPFWGGTEELARGLFIWVVLLGASLGVRTQEHFIVDVLPAATPPALQHGLRLLVAAIVLAVTLVIAVYGWDFAISGFARRSLATHWPATWSYSALTVGGAFMTVFALRALVLAVLHARQPADARADNGGAG
jgi:TRAP-type C4-dicarboxylate transport system permease small subunit